MAKISLKIESDFKQAEKDFKKMKPLTDAARESLTKFKDKLSGEQLDKFTMKNKRMAIAMTATKGKFAGMKTEAKGLEREIQRLIKGGLDPMDWKVVRLTKDYDKLQKEMGQTAKSSSKLSKVMKAGMIYFSGRAILQFGKHLLTAASAGVELQNKFSVVFKGITAETDAWVDNYAVAVGRGGEKTKDFLTTLQDIRTGFGDTNAKAAKFSQAVVGVTNDLSSFSNVPFQEASDAIQSGLSGQFIALRKMGVGLNVNIINQGEYAKSLGKTWKDMSNLEKQEAILTGVMKQSKNAIRQNVSSWKDYDFTLGDAAKTSKSFANQTKLADGLLDDISGIIGNVFLPAANDMLKYVNELLAGFKAWAKNGDNLKNMLKNVGTVLAGMATGFIAYTIATNAATVASWSFAGSIKAIGKAFTKTNVIIAIISLIVMGLIKMAQHWDFVKFKVKDFALTAELYLAKMAYMIEKKVGGSIISLAKKLSKLPGMKKYFNEMAQNRRNDAKAALAHIKATERSMNKNRMSYNQSIRQKAKEIAAEKNKSKNIKKINDEITKNLKKNNKDQTDDNKKKEESMKEMLKRYSSNANEVMGYVSGVAGSLGNLFQAIADKKIASMDRSHNAAMLLIDSQLQAELAAAGVSESTEVEKAQIKLAEAVASGDAVTIKESQDAVTKAEIEEKYRKQKNEAEEIYRKKRAQAEYKAAMTAWKLQISMAAAQVPLAILNAVAAGAKFGIPGMIGFGAAAATMAGVQLAAVREAKPVAPTAQTGLRNYTVPDTMTNRNDKAAVMASGGETVDITPRGGQAEQTTEINIDVGEYNLFRIINRGISTGKINLNNKNINRGVFAT